MSDDLISRPITRAGWQPIDTAPKDGTPVLVWFRGGAHVARYSPLWHPDNLRWIVNHPKWDDRDMQVVSEIEPNEFQQRLGMIGPTLWMPITPPEPR